MAFTCTAVTVPPSPVAPIFIIKYLNLYRFPSPPFVLDVAQCWAHNNGTRFGKCLSRVLFLHSRSAQSATPMYIFQCIAIGNWNCCSQPNVCASLWKGFPLIKTYSVHVMCTIRHEQDKIIMYSGFFSLLLLLWRARRHDEKTSLDRSSEKTLNGWVEQRHYVQL